MARRKKTGGRKRGTPNKATARMREAKAKNKVAVQARARMREAKAKNKVAVQARGTFAETAQQFDGEALATLVEVMRDQAASPSARVRAAELVLDRAHGKAAPVLEQPRDRDFVPLAERLKWYARRDEIHPGAVGSRLSDEHFSVDGTLIEAWASHKSFRPKDRGGDEDGGANFHGQQRKNDTHASISDPDSRLYRKAAGREAKLCFMGHATMENRPGLAVAGMVTLADGTAERRASETMLKAKAGGGPPRHGGRRQGL
jgi:hypothetical protein